MKKIIKNIVWMPILALGLSSCTDWLDVKPTTSIVLQDMWKDQSDVEAVVASCYNAMLQNDFMQRVMAWGELRSDNLIQNNDPTTDAGKGVKEMYKSVSLSSILETDGITSWGAIYNVIKLCNFVDTYAPEVAKIDPDYLTSELNANLAEVRAIRALCYFYLIRTFKEVPYVDKPTLDDQQDLQVAPFTGDQIIPYLISDLEFAMNNAQSQYPTTEETKCRITRNAAAAILADVYLWRASGTTYNENNPAMSDSAYYDKAIECCDFIFKDTIASIGGGSSVMGGKSLYLLSTYASNFVRANNAEAIFGLYADRNTLWQQDKDNLVFINQAYGLPNAITSGMRGDWLTTYKVAPNEKYQKPASYTDDEFPYYVLNIKDATADARYWYCAGSSGTAYYVNKYEGTSINSVAGSPGFGNYPGWIFYRLADVYLMKAEAMVERMNARFELDEEGKVVYKNIANSDYYVGQMRKAHALIGRVYKRSNSMNATSPTFNATDEAMLVYAERRREFMFEGKRWYDLLRIARRDNKRTPEIATKKVIDCVKTKLSEGADLIGSRLSSMDALYWPINKSELQRNLKLQQNPYYVSKTSDIEK